MQQFATLITSIQHASIDSFARRAQRPSVNRNEASSMAGPQLEEPGGEDDGEVHRI
jgi:hypothetical protein